jgi:hypothetical protein
MAGRGRGLRPTAHAGVGHPRTPDRRPGLRPWCEKHAFLPGESVGGSNGPGGRLFVDSGVLNPELNAAEIGPAASKLWARSRLRDRIDAVIRHEHLEARGFSHDQAVQRAPETGLPISDHARRILRAQAEGVKRGR